MSDRALFPGGADGCCKHTGAAAAGGDQALLEVILHREEPIIGLRLVPAERVRLVKNVVIEQQTVTEDLRKEQVDLQSEPPDQPADPETQQRH